MDCMGRKWSGWFDVGPYPRAGRQVERQHLDGDLHLQPGVNASVHGAHTALPDFGHQRDAAQGGAVLVVARGVAQQSVPGQVLLYWF